jgi:hypothetical protein
MVCPLRYWEHVDKTGSCPVFCQEATTCDDCQVRTHFTSIPVTACLHVFKYRNPMLRALSSYVCHPDFTYTRIQRFRAIRGRSKTFPRVVRFRHIGIYPCRQAQCNPRPIRRNRVGQVSELSNRLAVGIPLCGVAACILVDPVLTSSGKRWALDQWWSLVVRVVRSDA